MSQQYRSIYKLAQTAPRSLDSSKRLGAGLDRVAWAGVGYASLAIGALLAAIWVAGTRQLDLPISLMKPSSAAEQSHLCGSASTTARNDRVYVVAQTLSNLGVTPGAIWKQPLHPGGPLTERVIVLVSARRENANASFRYCFSVQTYPLDLSKNDESGSSVILEPPIILHDRPTVFVAIRSLITQTLGGTEDARN